MLFFGCCFVQMQGQGREIDSMRVLIGKMPGDSMKVYEMSYLSRLFTDFGYPDSGLNYARKALGLSEKINYRWGKASSNLNHAVIYDAIGEYRQARKYHEAAIAFLKDANLKNDLAIAYNNYGLNLHNTGEYAKALECFLKALHEFESSKFKKGISYVYNNLGNLYHVQKQSDTAIKYYMASLRIDESEKDWSGVADSYNNLGSIYAELGKDSLAIMWHMKALDKYRVLGDRDGEADCYLNIAVVYTRQNNASSALKYYNKCIEINRLIDDKKRFINIHHGLADVYKIQGKYADAGKELVLALDLSMETQSLEEIKKTYNMIFMLDSATGNYKGAMYNFKQFLKFRDSIYNAENTSRQLRAEMEYVYSKQESAEKAEQEKRDMITAAKSRRRKAFIFGGCGILLLGAAFAAYVHRSNKQKQRDNEDLEQQKKIVEEKQKEIMDSIHYAQRIQKSSMATEKYLERSLLRLNIKSQ